MEKCKTKMEIWLFTSHTFEWLLARRIEKKIPDSLLTNKSYCIGPLIIWVEEGFRFVNYVTNLGAKYLGLPIDQIRQNVTTKTLNEYGKKAEGNSGIVTYFTSLEWIL